MNEELNLALSALRALKTSHDLRWIAQYVIERQGATPKLHGLKGGFAKYHKSRDLVRVRNLVAELEKDDLVTFGIVAEMIYDLLKPTTGEGRGQVEIKHIARDYLQIDFEESKKQGALVLQTDGDGNPVYYTAHYYYCYIRLYASRGDRDHSKPRLLSVYADSGMGKGGSGGYVAAALDDGLIDEKDILAAWHKGRKAYDTFIDECKSLVNGAD